MIGYSVLQLDAEHPVFDGHFPARPIVPGALLVDLAIEAIERETRYRVQAIALAKFLSPATPGETLELDYSITEHELRFEISSAGRKLASGRLLLDRSA